MTLITNPDGKIWLALKSRIDQWTETAVIDPDEKLYPASTSAFIIVQHVSLNTDPNNMDYDCGDEYRGFLNVSVMAPIGWTYGQHAGLAGRVCDFFAFGSKYTYSDATVTIYERPKSQGAVRLDLSWNRLEVQIPWRCWG